MATVSVTAQVVLDERPVRRAGIILSPGHAPFANLSGPEAAALMKVGVRVIRGPDWKWGDQVKVLNLTFILFDIRV